MEALFMIFVRRFYSFLIYIGMVSLFCPMAVMGGESVKVYSEIIKEKVFYYDFEGNCFVSIGKQSNIKIGEKKYAALTLPDGTSATVLLKKGPGKTDDWVGSYEGGEYKAVNGRAVLTASLAYRDVILNGEKRTFLMRKGLDEPFWTVALNDGKVYRETQGATLEHYGFRELRKVIYQGKTLYLTMNKKTGDKSVWTADFNGQKLISAPWFDIKKPVKEVPASIPAVKNGAGKKYKYKGIPGRVTSSRVNKGMTLSNLIMEKDKVAVQYVNNGEELFTLVVLFRLKSDDLVIYSDKNKTQTIHSSGKVLLTMNGFEHSGPDQNGTLTLPVKRKVFGVYSLEFNSGLVSVFTVKGSVDDVLNRVFKNNANLNADSNVLVKFLSDTGSKLEETSSSLQETVQTAQSAAVTAQNASKAAQDASKTAREVSKTVQQINKTLAAVRPLAGNVQHQQSNSTAKQYELIRARFYERGEAEIKQPNRRYSDTFFKNTARNIMIQVNFKNLAYQKENHNHLLTFNWINPDGTTRGVTTAKLNIQSGWETCRQNSGWGWNDPGNWPLGEYRVKILMDNAPLKEKIFKIIQSGFESQTVKFFEHGSQIPEQSQRKYAVQFSRAQTRYMNCEVGFKNLFKNQKDQSYTISRVWYNRNGEVEGSQDDKLVINSKWDSCLNRGNGWGWADPGKWAPGNYKLEIFVNNNFQTRQYFEIVD